MCMDFELGVSSSYNEPRVAFLKSLCVKRFECFENSCWIDSFVRKILVVIPVVNFSEET